MKYVTPIALAAALLAGAPAWAQFKVVGLGFEGMQEQTLGTYEPAQVWEFYNGGFSRSEDGSTNLVQGPDYNVSFDATGLAIASYLEGPGTGPFGPRFLDSQAGPELTTLGISALVFNTSAAVVLNYASGFDTGFSFYYSSTADVTVTLYSGENRTGNVLGSGSFDLIPNCSLDDNTYCVWKQGAIGFAGTARSVEFSGVQSQALFDNVTFGSTTPIDGVILVPEPATYGLMALGLAALGLATRRRRHG